MRRVVPFFVALVSACECGPLGVSERRFACTTSAECLDGFVCIDVGAGLECVRLDGTTFDAGGDAGQIDAGPPDAGVDDAGSDAGVDAGPPDSGRQLAFGSVPDVLTGKCLPVSINHLENGDLLAVSSALTINVSASPATSVRLSSMATCADTISSVRIEAQRSSTQLFVKPLTAGRVRLTAASTLPPAEAQFTSKPIVRRTVCSMPAAGPALPDGGPGTPGLVTTCSFAPAVEDLSHSFFVMQPISTTLLLIGSGEVACRFASTSSIRCERSQDSDEATLYFQVVELPTGVRVVHPPASVCTASSVFDGGLDLGRTTTLKWVATASNFYDDDDSASVLLKQPDELATLPDRCGLISAQFLEWSAATLVRGFFDGGTTGPSATLDNLAPAGPNTALFSQTLIPDAVAEICSAMVRPAIASPTSLSFSRGADGGCAFAPFPGVAFERIDFGSFANVQQHIVRSPVGETSTAVTVRPYDVSRTILFASNQSVAGQGCGETNMVGSRLFTGGMVALIPGGATQVSALRPDITSDAVHTVYLVEFNP